MADQLLTANRRLFLGGGALAAVAAVSFSGTALGTPAPSRAAWDVALAHRNATLAASDAYDRETFDPAYDRETFDPAYEREKAGRGYEMPDHINDKHDRLVDEYVDAEWALMDIPAPDRPALLWKLEKVIEPESESTPSWRMDCIKQTTADCRRLLGGAA